MGKLSSVKITWVRMLTTPSYKDVVMRYIHTWTWCVTTYGLTTLLCALLWQQSAVEASIWWMLLPLILGVADIWLGRRLAAARQTYDDALISAFRKATEFK